MNRAICSPGMRLSQTSEFTSNVSFFALTISPLKETCLPLWWDAIRLLFLCCDWERSSGYLPSIDSGDDAMIAACCSVVCQFSHPHSILARLCNDQGEGESIPFKIIFKDYLSNSFIQMSIDLQDISQSNPLDNHSKGFIDVDGKLRSVALFGTSNLVLLIENALVIYQL